MTDQRKQEIQDEVSSAIERSGIRPVRFGDDFTYEEKEYALRVGGNFGLIQSGNSIMVLAGMHKGRVAV